MTAYEAIQIVEGECLSTEEEQLEAWQWLIDTGIVWTLQGTYGRFAADLIEEGVCTA